MPQIDYNILENKAHPKLRLNAVCPYFAMFPLAFPYKVLSGASRADTVYDPFCGRGTTNYAARLLGLTSYGVDSNPMAHAIAQAKLIQVKPRTVVKLCADILLQFEPKYIPIGEFWEWAYHADTLIDICRIREYLLTKDKLNTTEIALRAILLGILHGPLMKTQASYLSNQMPRTFATKPQYSVKYWKTRAMYPTYINVLELVKRKANYIFNDDLPPKTHGKIVLGDSRVIPDVFRKNFDWIVTSPPYYGMSTYKQDQWLRNWLLGDEAEVNYSNELQLSYQSEQSFVKGLAQVWANVTQKSNPKAQLVIRFGALPSKSEKAPEELITASLQLSNCGWQIKSIQSAGKPPSSKRQANQFKNSTGNYIEEIDVFAQLN